MSRLALLAVAVACVLFTGPLLAQDPPDEKAIRENVERLVAEEMKKLRASLEEIVRRELGGAAAPAPQGEVEKALALITEDLLKKHANFLASDELQGRNSGYPGNDKATKYIAEVMKQAGLKPVGDKDAAGNATYFQAFKVQGLDTRNCLGLLEGTDPDLKREYIVIGAHHDHIGTADQEHPGRLGRPRDGDNIYNGADDNGSGTTTVLGVIKAFGEGGLKTKRSILFMTFSGEEWGLNGSQFYVKNPIVPIGQHVFMLNLDMVGRNPDKPVGIQGVGSDARGHAKKAAEEAVAKTGLKAAISDRVTIMGGDSDHSSFRNAGVPFAFFFSGFHPDWHGVLDHADRLAYPNMVKIGQTSVHMLLSLGNAAEGPGRRAVDPGRPVEGRKFGFTPGGDLTADEYGTLGLGANEGAVRVDSVTPETVAERAGLKKGDYILSVGGQKLVRGRESDTMRAAIRGADAGKDVPVEVLRGSDRVTLKAKWDK